jgi:hypothetical protein
VNASWRSARTSPGRAYYAALERSTLAILGASFFLLILIYYFQIINLLFIE